MAEVLFARLDDIPGEVEEALEGQLTAVNLASVAGFDPTGSADQSTIIQNQLDALKAAGGGTLYIPPGQFRIANTITLTDASGVNILGAGAQGGRNPVGLAATRLVWTGTPGETMLLLQSSPGSTAPLMGCRFEDFTLELVSSALTGIHMINGTFNRFENISIYQPAENGWGMRWTCNDNPPATLVGNQHNTVSGLVVRNDQDGTVGFELDGVQSAPGGGVTENDSTLNYLENLWFNHTNGDGLSFRFADGNYAVFVRNFIPAGGTGRPVVFKGSDVDFGRRARHNAIFGWQGGSNGVGITSLAGTAGNAEDNVVYNLGLSNSALNTPPVVQAGTTFHYFTSTFANQPGLRQGVFTGGEAAPNTAEANIVAQRALLGTESLRVLNTGDNHIRLVSPGGAEYAVDIDNSTGDLRLRHISGGSGVILLPGGASGSFTAQSGETITVTNGVITGIV